MRRRRDHITGQRRGRALSRRTFLGGLGAALSLPWLEAMAPVGRALADTPAAPNRLLFYFVPNGLHMEAFTPKQTGTGYDLTPILAPLAAHQSKLNVLSGLANVNAIVPVAGDHARGTGSFLTCVTPVKSEGADVFNGKSVDQVAAEAIGDATLFPSLQLGTVNAISIGSCDSGYSCAYSRNISWAGPSTPLPKISKPQVLFDRLFGGMDPAATEEEIARRRLLRTSVLDNALEDAVRLQALLGKGDQLKVGEYLESVYEVEQLIQQAAEAPACAVPTAPGAELDTPALLQSMSDLMAIALTCDMTRVITFMLGDGGSNRSYDFIGVPGAHHEISHHQNDPGNWEKLTTIDIWETEQLAYLLDRLDAVDEGDGTLLDHSAVFWSSEIEDGNSHAHKNLPVLLAGGASGQIPTGRHLVYEDEEPMADLFVSLLETVGVEVDTFGADGTGPLAGLAAAPSEEVADD